MDAVDHKDRPEAIDAGPRRSDGTGSDAESTGSVSHHPPAGNPGTGPVFDPTGRSGWPITPVGTQRSTRGLAGQSWSEATHAGKVGAHPERGRPGERRLTDH